MKQLLTAVLITLVLVYCFGQVVEHCFDWYLEVDGNGVHILSVLLWVGMAVAILIAVGFLLAFSLFGVLAFVMLVVLGSIFIAGLSLIWPLVLLIAFVTWLVKSKPQSHA